MDRRNEMIELCGLVVWVGCVGVDRLGGESVGCG